MDEKPRLQAKLKHDLRSPYSTLMGVIAALQDEPDMDREDQAEFLQILERETQTCLSLSDDLYTLHQNVIRSNSQQPTGAVAIGEVVKNLTENEVPKRPHYPGLEVTIKTESPNATLPGDIALWTLISVKLIDHAISHANENTSIQLSLAENSIELLQTNTQLSTHELEALTQQLPQRAKRRRYNPYLGMGAYIAFRLAECCGLQSTASNEEGSLRIRIFGEIES